MRGKMEKGWPCCSMRFGPRRLPLVTIVLRFKSDQMSPQPLKISFVDINSGDVSDAFIIPDLRKGVPEKGDIKKLSFICKWRYREFEPCAVLVTTQEADVPMSLFLVSISLMKGLRRWGASISFPCFSWISSEQGQRTFFSGVPLLPSQTPKPIKVLREAELAHLSTDDGQERSGSDRIYEYDLYNDLSNTEDSGERQPWGGSKDRPYPRRIRTGRPLNPSGNSESRPSDPVTGQVLPFWVPEDDDLVPAKLRGFFGRLAIAAGRSRATIALFGGPTGGFPDIASITRMYHPEPEGPGFPVPRAFEGRENAWKSDAEFGRQRIAGVHPTTIEAISSLPKTSSITDVFVKPALLDGATLEDRLKQGRMYMVDYTSLFLDLVDKINAQKGPIPRFQYAPRCLLYFNDSRQLMPVAIELSTPSQSDVYTPNSSLTEWTLAKAHFSAADLSVHEVHTHFTRAHACTESYVIAARRKLSSMHPIFRLIMPHFVDTLRVNAAARQILIDAGGTLESLFTPGSFLGTFAVTAYGKLWRFRTEGLPADLMKRNMATAPKGADWRAGEVDLVLKDYPFAEDGLLLWQSIHAWVTRYLEIYYTGPADVAGDSELQAWWEDIKTNGQPDLVKFGIATEKEVWPPMGTIEELTYILVTMIWIASGHHAAINFGQYDYAAYLPNTPSYMVAPMPPSGAISTPVDVLDETLYLRSLSPPVIAAGVAATTEALSTAGEGDVFLGTEIPFWLSDPRARKGFKYFSRMTSSNQKQIIHRNRQSLLPSREFAYTLLLPKLKKGDETPVLAFRGIPNNVGE